MLSFVVLFCCVSFVCILACFNLLLYSFFGHASKKLNDVFT